MPTPYRWGDPAPAGVERIRERRDRLAYMAERAADLAEGRDPDDWTAGFRINQHTVTWPERHNDGCDDWFRVDQLGQELPIVDARSLELRAEFAHIAEAFDDIPPLQSPPKRWRIWPF